MPPAGDGKRVVSVLKGGKAGKPKGLGVEAWALVESGLDNPERLTELAWAEARLAQFGDASIERWRQVETLLTKADASTPLGDWEEELLTVARIALLGAPR